MKFTVEILLHSSGKSVVLNRCVVEAISPKWAKTRALELMKNSKKQKANGFVIRNNKDEQEWREQ
jgi:hypothetical protein